MVLVRFLIVKCLVEVVWEVGVDVVVYGCIGKGNDQVCFDVVIVVLVLDFKVFILVCEWGMSCEEIIVYGECFGLFVLVSKKLFYLIDFNLLGCSIEVGLFEDLMVVLLEEVFVMM